MSNYQKYPNTLQPKNGEFLIYEREDDSEVTKHPSAQWYAPENVVGPPVFNTGETLRQKVISAPSVRKAVQEYKRLFPKMPTYQIENKVSDITSTLGADFGERSIRLMAWSVDKILSQLYHGIYIAPSEFERVKETARKCYEHKIPMILCPTHKSHMDYLVISYVFFRNDISLPFIAAGDNLNMPLVGRLLRNSGAFYIKRDGSKSSPDHTILYRAIFDEYIQQILSQGYSMEFFLEGGRSRSGKLLRPKRGLLSQVVKSVVEERTSDAYIVPISITYDKVIETESYVKELLGKPKEKESLGGLISSSRYLSLNFGRIDFRLAEPFSLKQWLTSTSIERNLSLAIDKDLSKLIKTLSYDVLYRTNLAAVAMPTAIVAAAFLTNRGRGLTTASLVKRYEWITELIHGRGGKTAVKPANVSTEELVLASVGVLGKMLQEHKDILDTIYTPVRRVELSFYRNQCIHYFVEDGILACAMYAFQRPQSYINAVSRQAMKNDAKLLSQLFKTEFIFPPSGNFKQNFERSLERILQRGVFVIPPDKPDHLAPADKGKERREYEFLCALFWPFLDTFWLMAASFYSLLPNIITDEKSFLQRVQQFGLNLYHQGELSFFESLSNEYLKDSMENFLSDGVLTKQRDDNPLIQLSTKYQNEEVLLELIDSIGKFRRESKYAKDPDQNFPSAVMKLAKKLKHNASKL